MPRPQFTLKTMLWLMVCVACFFAGMDIGHQRAAEDAKFQALLWLRKVPAEYEDLRQLGFVEMPVQGDAPADSPPPIGVGVFVALLSRIALTGALLLIRSHRRPGRPATHNRGLPSSRVA